MPMGIRQLRYFVSVAEAKSFTKASELLQVAQPALGMQIRKLEEGLGVKLLVRHSRGVETTEAGAVLAGRAVSLLQEFDRMCQEVASIGGEPSGCVSIGVTQAVMHLAAAKLARACLEKYPAIDLILTEGLSEQVVQSLADHRLDLGLAFSPEADARLEKKPLAIETLYLAVPRGHPAANAETITLREALAYDLVVSSKSSPFRHCVEHAAAESGLELRVACEAHSVSMLKELVCNGLGCAIVSYGSAKPEVQNGQLSILRIVEPEITRTLFLTYSKTRESSRAALAVREEALAVVEELVRSEEVDWSPVASDG
jgi:LysR family nitrogen assimilation transcriptional regulator